MTINFKTADKTQAAKDVFHTVLPFAVSFLFPYGWVAFAFLYAYFIAKFYYYIIKAGFNRTTDIAVYGFFIHAVLLYGYLNGLC